MGREGKLPVLTEPVETRLPQGHGQDATRLRITESDEFDSFMVPAASIPELIVSYALSTAGKVSINEEMVEDRYNRFKEAYRIRLQFFGDETGRGWFESHLVLKHSVVSALGKRRQRLR